MSTTRALTGARRSSSTSWAGADRVLDVGCSTGYLAERMQKQGSTVVGLDVDERSAELARQFCEAVYVGDVETMELPFEPGTFDVILCGDLIEHLRDPQAFLARIRPFLRPGGRLVLSTPNIANWAMRLSLLFGRFRYTEWGILDQTHTHLFTRKTLEETLRAAGYRITDLRLHRAGAGALHPSSRGPRPRDREAAPLIAGLPVRRRGGTSGRTASRRATVPTDPAER